MWPPLSEAAIFKPRLFSGCVDQSPFDSPNTPWACPLSASAAVPRSKQSGGRRSEDRGVEEQDKERKRGRKEMDERTSMLERAVQNQPDSNDYIMAVFVCAWDRCCACKTIQLIIVEKSAAWAANTRVSVSGTHSLLFSPSHSCINTLTHAANTRKSLSDTGRACVGSEITVRHTFPLSIL